MKNNEMHYEEYLQANEKQNLHPKLDKVLKKFPHLDYKKVYHAG